MPSISYSTSGFNDRNIEAALDGIAAAGFDHVEICGQEPHVDTPPQGQALQEFRRRLEQRGFVGGTVHAPMRHNVLGAPDAAWRAAKVPVFASYLRFAAAIGCSGLIIHPVPNPMFVDDPERPELAEIMLDATRRSLDELVPLASACGVRMLLENLPYHCNYPLLCMEELRPLVNAYPEAAVGLVIDTGHAWTIKRDPATQIRVAGERLWGTHIQDVDHEDPQDNHWLPGHGELDWQGIRAALKEIKYAGFWTFEVIVPRHNETPEELSQLTRKVAAAWGLG